VDSLLWKILTSFFFDESLDSRVFCLVEQKRHLYKYYRYNFNISYSMYNGIDEIIRAEPELNQILQKEQSISQCSIEDYFPEDLESQCCEFDLLDECSSSYGQEKDDSLGLKGGMRSNNNIKERVLKNDMNLNPSFEMVLGTHQKKKEKFNCSCSE